MKTLPDREACGRRLLDLAPDPVPRFLILRDILRRSAREAEVRHAREEMLRTRAVAEVAAGQQSHGGWPRFHTQDYGSGLKIGTTEQAVQRAVEVGLEPSDGILARARGYLENLLAHRLPFPDRPERNDRWATGEEMFVASTLAWIDAHHPALEPVYDKWRRIAELAFAGGGYDAEAEWRAHCQLTGATTMRGSYLALRNRYAVYLLSRVQDRLVDRTETALVEWLWTHPQGLGYLDVPLSCPFRTVPAGVLPRWFFSHRVLSGFRSWRRKAERIRDELWAARNKDGLWDFGPRARTGGLRLSENWRRASDRIVDHSLAVLLLFGEISRPAGGRG